MVWNRPRPGHKGPIKKNTPMDEIPFLAVARSLGDLWSYNPQNDEFIVSPDPDVGVLTIDPTKFRYVNLGFHNRRAYQQNCWLSRDIKTDF